jgi:SSS family solute:Na+ symporter
MVGLAARTQLYDKIPVGADGIPMPDKAFIVLMFEQFPVGVTGLLVAGIMAALVSTIDGMISSSSSLLTNDFYLRFMNKNASGKAQKNAMRIFEVIIIVLSLVVVALFIGSRSSFELIQAFFGDIMGVMIGLYLVGIFSRRITARAAFLSMVISVVISVTLDLTTSINFAYIGNISFLSVILLSTILSRFEKPIPEASLENLTVWTMPGIKGPWIGLQSWNNLKWWIAALPIAWILITLSWQAYMR